jgi:hypothetical protein
MGNIISSKCICPTALAATLSKVPDTDSSLNHEEQPQPEKFNELIGPEDIVAAFRHALALSKEK